MTRGQEGGKDAEDDILMKPPLRVKMLVHTDNILVNCCHSFRKTVFITMNMTKNYLLKILSALNIPEKMSHSANRLVYRLNRRQYVGATTWIMTDIFRSSFLNTTETACLANTASNSPGQDVHTDPMSPFFC
ncbi:hypothetical protein CRENBAI_003518 [Crenichthys baileyi]|uniref:Uncharacterized protein n=1 Tax=Crenichthys baileyi TaxID=28760 RepID=A0AAV9R9H5_9TELE